jgi:hypothetical protein
MPWTRERERDGHSPWPCVNRFRFPPKLFKPSFDALNLTHMIPPFLSFHSSVCFFFPFAPPLSHTRSIHPIHCSAACTLKKKEEEKKKKPLFSTFQNESLLTLHSIRNTRSSTNVFTHSKTPTHPCCYGIGHPIHIIRLVCR